jgi:membrane associated rhomboid family serine protease
MTYRPPTTFSLIPPVIKNLLIINALVFVASIGPLGTMIGETLRHWFALWPVGVPDGVVEAMRVQYNQAVGSFYPWQLITAAFLHGSFGHILFNMFGLWMFGMRIENVWGSGRFAFYYFACVLGASLLQLAVTSVPFLFGDAPYPPPVPTLGASGGVLGVLLAFGMLYPEEPIYLYFFIPVKAKWLVIGLAAFDLFAGVTGTQAGVANFAHVGGMLTGFLLILYWRGTLRLRPSNSHAAVR